jgi:hypothetical protein
MHELGCSNVGAKATPGNSGTMTGPMTVPDGTQIGPTGRSFSVDFYTVAHS